VPHAPLILVWFACQQPFGTNRHDLAGFRVAAVTAEPAGGPLGAPLTASAAVVVDGQLWSDAPVRLSWYWTEATDAAVLAASGPPDAEGPAPSLVKASDRLVLVAEHDGDEYRAFLDLPETPLPAPALNGVDVLDLGLAYADVPAVDYAVDTRLTWEGAPADAVPSGGLARLEARLGVPDAPFLRWMSTGGGTFFELDPLTADWAAGDVVVDDEDLTVGDPVASGGFTVLALGLGDAGNHAFVTRDVFVGDVPTGLFTTSDRFLPAPEAYSATLVRGTLVADGGPSGLALVDTAPVDAAALPPDDPYGTASLCGSWNRPFDPSWLVSQRCTRADVIGHTVVVEAR
jgi:hypothetical protein